MSAEQAVIFDLGGVVINLAIEKTIQSFREKIPGFTNAQFIGKPDQHEIFNRYETGVTSTEQFYQEFQDHYRCKIGFESFRTSWNAMILDLPCERIEFLETLKSEGIRIFLLSNINLLHAAHVETVYDDLGMGGAFRALFERTYYSFEMGLRKPDPRIFERVLSENGLNKVDTLFIDDTLQHVEAARRLGIETIHLLKPQTIDKLSL
jgi:epoxide hydrolase-like predicted phosphatase